ncbi:diguanylate cyclase (GGDEF) domain-containing protein [Alkalispirochaeta americana]|uniref:diguanylate cyclase n=1 Tax=Alkalispirochaeta americana TaxID=159291 RepID=A0A1N6N6J8_9SPIO|nr:diguanylate cyclase [Alkalispirochaeta americana]SIP87673.1 diguanylate cyclase (GGDEF) domain-containing protein [Alkalispirochaeta americana]
MGRHKRGGPRHNLRHTKELEQAFLGFLEVYLTERNMDGIIPFLSPHMTGFGTALNERGDSLEQSLELFARDLEQAPDPIPHELLFLEALPLGRDSGFVRAEADLHASVLGQRVDLLNCRFTAVFRDCPNRGMWCIEHFHISLPSVGEGDYESYPVAKLEEQATLLERLVQERTKELRQARDRLEVVAATDTLTGISNRLKAGEVLHRELARLQRYGGVFSVVLLDIDFFKTVNDRFGHHGGDQVLRETARLLREGVRDTDTVARWGGEEFLLLCPENSVGEAAALAERLRGTCATHDFEIPRRVTASFGVAQAVPGDSPESLVERADRALYRAKEGGRNRVEADEGPSHPG